MASNTLQEWLNRNAYRAYPFEENTNFLCTNGKFLPKSLILDFRCCIFDENCVEMAISEVNVLKNGEISLKIQLNGSNDDNSIILTTKDGIAVKNDENMSFRAICCKKERLNGFFGDFILKKPARILKSRILSIPYGIGVDTLSAGGVESTGIVNVGDGHNTSLDIRSNNLVLTVKKGLGKGAKCGDDLDGPSECPTLYYINGQKADSNGNIQIKGGDGITVTSGTYKGIPAVIITTSATVNSFIYR